MSTLTTINDYRAAYIAKLIPNALKQAARIRRTCTGIAVAAMGISYEHQSSYLHDLGAGITGWFAPGVIDAAIFACVVTIHARGLVTKSHRAALGILIPLVLISGTLNAMAPAPLILRGVYAAVVALILGGEHLASTVEVDWDAVEVDVTEATPITTRKLAPEVAAERAEKSRITRERKRLALLTPAQKAKLTRDANRAAELAEAEADRAAELSNLNAGYDLPDAPVSPAA